MIDFNYSNYFEAQIKKIIEIMKSAVLKAMEPRSTLFQIIDIIAIIKIMKIG